MKNTLIAILLLIPGYGFAGGTQWIYNYSNIPIAPVVQPQYNYQQYYQPTQQIQPIQQYRAGSYTVIQQGGQQAVCVNQGRMITCY